MAPCSLGKENQGASPGQHVEHAEQDLLERLLYCRGQDSRICEIALGLTGSSGTRRRLEGLNFRNKKDKLICTTEMQSKGRPLSSLDNQQEASGGGAIVSSRRCLIDTGKINAIPLEQSDACEAKLDRLRHALRATQPTATAAVAVAAAAAVSIMSKCAPPHDRSPGKMTWPGLPAGTPPKPDEFCDQAHAAPLPLQPIVTSTAMRLKKLLSPPPAEAAAVAAEVVRADSMDMQRSAIRGRTPPPVLGTRGSTPPPRVSVSTGRGRQVTPTRVYFHSPIRWTPSPQRCCSSTQQHSLQSRLRLQYHSPPRTPPRTPQTSLRSELANWSPWVGNSHAQIQAPNSWAFPSSQAPVNAWSPPRRQHQSDGKVTPCLAAPMNPFGSVINSSAPATPASVSRHISTFVSSPVRLAPTAAVVSVPTVVARRCTPASVGLPFAEPIVPEWRHLVPLQQKLGLATPQLPHGTPVTPKSIFRAP